MSIINTTDNNCGKALRFLLPDDTHESLKQSYTDLRKIANIPIGELVKNNPGLIIFPPKLNIYKDDIDKAKIITLSGNSEDGTHYENCKLTTENTMGFIGSDNTRLTITSRFTPTWKEDFFLHYMLQKVLSINLFDLKHVSEINDGFDFMLYLFPLFLKRAVSQGIYRTYRTFKQNDSAVKGVIDINRNIKHNMPFRGKIAYQSREYSYDNPLTQLVRHTIEYVKTQSLGRYILSKDIKTKEATRQIIEATNLYTPAARSKILQKNAKPLQHPYYTEYSNLQQICLMILRHYTCKYSNNGQSIYGILFDGAWLWEEYLWTVLKECNFEHPKNKTHEGRIQLFKTGGYRYPDFYRNTGELKTSVIMDAKYKRLMNRNGETAKLSQCVQREDLNQLITYMHILPANHGVFIFPSDIGDNATAEVHTPTHAEELCGLGGKINAFEIPIPQKAASFAEFACAMKQTELQLKEKVSYSFID